MNRPIGSFTPAQRHSRGVGWTIMQDRKRKEREAKLQRKMLEEQSRRTEELERQRIAEEERRRKAEEKRLKAERHYQQKGSYYEYPHTARGDFREYDQVAVKSYKTKKEPKKAKFAKVIAIFGAVIGVFYGLSQGGNHVLNATIGAVAGFSITLLSWLLIKNIPKILYSLFKLLIRVVIAIFVIIAGLLILKVVAKHFHLNGVNIFLEQLFIFANNILASIF